VAGLSRRARNYQAYDALSQILDSVFCGVEAGNLHLTAQARGPHRLYLRPERSKLLKRIDKLQSKKKSGCKMRRKG
jgi:hypothetical protein